MKFETRFLTFWRKNTDKLEFFAPATNQAIYDHIHLDVNRIAYYTLTLYQLGKCMAGVFECGFARVAVKETYNDLKVKDEGKRLERYLSFFEEPYKENFTVTQKTFSKRSRILVSTFNKWLKSDDKPKYIEHFSHKAWSTLSLAQKAAHTVTNCKACEVYHNTTQSLFPLKCTNIKRARLVQDAENEIAAKRYVRPTKAAAKQTVSNIFNKVQQPFREIFNVNLTDVIASVPSLGLQKKPRPVDMKKKRRQTNTTHKKSIEEQWAAVDTLSFLGTRQSFSQRDKQRKTLSFESFQVASQRAVKRKCQEAAGERASKRHSPDPANVDFDKQGLLDKVNSMSDGDQVCLIVLTYLHSLIS